MGIVNFRSSVGQSICPLLGWSSLSLEPRAPSGSLELRAAMQQCGVKNLKEILRRN